MFGLFSSKKKGVGEAIGVYISGESLLWARVVREDARMRVDGHGILPVSDIKALRTYVTAPVMSVVPPEETTVFSLTLPRPSSPHTNVQEYIQEEIASHIGHRTSLRVEDVICEYEIRSMTEATLQVTVTAYPRSLMMPLTQSLQSLGFRSVGMCAMPYALMRMHHDADHAYLLVVIEPHGSHVALIDRHTVVAMRMIPVGHDMLLQGIQSFLNIPRTEAQKIFDRYGILPSHREPKLLGELTRMLAPVVDELQSLYFHWHAPSSSPSHPITDIVVAGTGARIPGLLQYLEETLHLPARHIDVWRLFPNMEEVIPEVSWHEALKYAPAIAAAVEKIRE